MIKSKQIKKAKQATKKVVFMLAYFLAGNR